MKLTKETLKRIIKEEMMQVMHEMDSEQTNGKPETLEDFKTRLEAESDPSETTFEFQVTDDERLRIDQTHSETRGGNSWVWYASIDADGDLVVDGDNNEQYVGIADAMNGLIRK